MPCYHMSSTSCLHYIFQVISAHYNTGWFTDESHRCIHDVHIHDQTATEDSCKSLICSKEDRLSRGHTLLADYKSCRKARITVIHSQAPSVSGCRTSASLWMYPPNLTDFFGGFVNVHLEKSCRDRTSELAEVK
jgi:hypothetical protein